MTGRDYIQIQNQGNIISNIRLLYEMKNSDGYADSQGYFSKRDVAEIGCNALIITTGSKIGEEVTSVINSSGDESRNSPLQNAKARMQLLRVLGLVSTDYGAETYAITKMGELIINQVLSINPNMGLLRELFLHISSSTEVYEHNCDPKFNCFLGYGIMYAFSHLDYKISTDEMPLLTAYDISEIDQFVEDAKKYRELDIRIPQNHSHFPKTSKGKPLKIVSNLTRSINQILRTCGIIQGKVKKTGNKNYYVCTDDGKEFVDKSTKRFIELKFLTAYQFRKMNNISNQKELCYTCQHNILVRSGSINEQSFLSDYNKYVFSPYQMIPETNVEWLLGGHIRKHPDNQENKVLTINSQINRNNIQVHNLFFNTQTSNIDLTPLDNKIVNLITDSTYETKSIDELSSIICELHKPYGKECFYPFVHTILRIIGLRCEGEIGRFDGLCYYENHKIPIEIKSYLETPSYDLKGLRQAVENKIMAYNPKVEDDISFASFVVGFEHPTSDQEVRTFIDSALDNFCINIIATDIFSLTKMAIQVIRDKVSVNLHNLLTSHGILRG